MVSSIRPHDNKKMDNGYYGNSNIGVFPQPHLYNRSKVDRLKFCLVVLNTILFISGSVTLGFSVYGLIQYEVLGYTELFKSVLLSTIIPWIAAISGTLSVTMIPLCGCHGAVAERRNLLVLYFMFLLLMFLTDLVMCIWIIVAADQIQKDVESSLRMAVLAYHQDADIRRALDDLQRHLVCCGSDYGVIDYGLWGPPPSCVHESLFTPCIGRMRQLYTDYWLTAVAAFAVMGVVLVITMVLVIMLLSTIKSMHKFHTRMTAHIRSDANTNVPPPPPPPPPPPLAPPSTTSSPQGCKQATSQPTTLHLAHNHNQISVV